MEQAGQHRSFRQRWSAARPSKTLMVWSWVACVALTMAIGFTWGGWVRGATARDMAATAAEEALVKHLAPVCFGQFKRDPAREKKREELLALSEYDWSDYVTKQGWANMPGGGSPDSKVADACARLVAS